MIIYSSIDFNVQVPEFILILKRYIMHVQSRCFNSFAYLKCQQFVYDENIAN